MLTLIAYLIAALLFLLAGCNQDLFSQPPADEVAWGLFFCVVARLLTGIWRPAPWPRKQP